MDTPHPLLAKLERVLDLDAAERSALGAVPIQEAEVRADHDILHEGDRPSRCFMILEGVTCVSQMVEGGRRQIDGFHIPGDMPDLHLTGPEWIESGLRKLQQQIEQTFRDGSAALADHPPPSHPSRAIIQCPSRWQPALPAAEMRSRPGAD